MNLHPRAPARHVKRFTRHLMRIAILCVGSDKLLHLDGWSRVCGYIVMFWGLI